MTQEQIKLLYLYLSNPKAEIKIDCNYICIKHPMYDYWLYAAFDWDFAKEYIINKEK